MSTQALKDTIKRELPNWLRDDPAFRSYVLELTRDAYAGRRETNDWFQQTLGEMRRERERQDALWHESQAELRRMREDEARKWDEQNQKWEENQAELRRMREEQARKWDEQNQKWEGNQAELRRMREEQARKWEEQNKKWEDNQAELRRMREDEARKWDEQGQKWDEQNKKWDEQSKKWEENQAEHNKKWEANQAELKVLHQEIMAIAQRQDRSIGALGARWGLQSEKAFRDALAAILEKSFDVQVLNVCEYDDEGGVFGRPEQVELDVIITNGLLILCELKSSIDKAGMYSFERKARFYERRHQRQADRLIVISPMIDPRAKPVAERLGIETFGDSTDLRSLYSV